MTEAEAPSPHYVVLEGGRVAHVIGDDEHTECRLPIPFDARWTSEQPDKVCAKCQKAEDADAT